MSKIEDAREKINQTDKQIAKLFESRMALSEDISRYKQENGLPVFDAYREAELLKKNADYIENPQIREYYILFQKKVMELSRNYQERLMSGIKVAYSGAEGAYAYLAAKKLYPFANLISKDSFHDAYFSVQNGECDICILPLENNYAGEIGTVTELMYSGDLYINRVINLAVRHALLGTQNSSLQDIKKVVSHPQALKQCDEYILKNGFLSEEFVNTASAAKAVKTLGDKTVAAIASEENAELYGLKILEKNINSSGSNTTRFASFSRVQNSVKSDKINPNRHFVIVFTVQNKAGALAQTLNIIGSHGYNMRTLRSHPKKSLDWEYFFYIEADGDINTANGQELMHELSAVCGDLKLLGSYCEQSEENL